MNRRKAASLMVKTGAAALFGVSSASAIAFDNDENEGNLDLENRVKEKVMKSTAISPYQLKQIKAMKPFRENNISLVYEIFKELDDSSIGYGSINFNREKREMDLGIDEFSFFTSIGLFFAGIFSSKYTKISDMRDMRTYLDFHENWVWRKYREGIPIRGNPETTPHEYFWLGNIVNMDGNDFAHTKGKTIIHNPLSVAFEILNGKRPNNFEMVANANHSKNIQFNYQKVDSLENFMIVEANFDKSIIKNFKRIYALCYNNIPLSGYILLEKADMGIIRGSLSDIRIDGKSILHNGKEQ